MEDIGKLDAVKLCRSFGKKVLLLCTYHTKRNRKRMKAKTNDRKSIMP